MFFLLPPPVPASKLLVPLQIDAPRRGTEPLQFARILGKVVERVDVLLVEIDDLEVLLDPRGSD